MVRAVTLMSAGVPGTPTPMSSMVMLSSLGPGSCVFAPLNGPWRFVGWMPAFVRGIRPTAVALSVLVTGTRGIVAGSGRSPVMFMIFHDVCLPWSGPA